MRIREVPLSSTIVITFEKYFNVGWLFWRSYLDIGLSNTLKSPVPAAKYPCDVFLRKNGSSSELEHQGFLALLVVDWLVVVDLLLVRDCTGACVWRTWNLWGNLLKSVTGENREWQWGQIKPVYMWYLDLLVW